MKKVKIKKMYSDVSVPSYAKEGDAGMDLRAYIKNRADEKDYRKFGEINLMLSPEMEVESITIAPQARIVIPTGICIQLNINQEAQVRPRSGQSIEKGFDVALGTIDSGYIGEIGVIVRNFTDRHITIEHNEKIAQIVISTFDSVELEEAETLDDTERGSGGYGHTGNK